MRQLKTRSGRSMDLAKIHIAAEQLGLRSANDDSAYRDMLWSIGRVRSAADLDFQGRRQVLEHLRRCGFVDRPSKGSFGPKYDKGSPEALIRYLWTELYNCGRVRDRSDRALRRYIAQHAGLDNPGVDELAPQHLNNAECTRVIAQLKSWLERK